jgi:2-polyprenyl-3-methyl-5-hydroxy-6-metoxy-1,4-benzoquinol methylase
MKKPEFDKYAARYDNLLTEAIPEGLNEDGYFAEYKIALISNRIQQISPLKILDFGCGGGRSLPYLDKYFPNAELWGFDVSSSSLKSANERVPRAKLFSEWSVIANTRFDVIVAANVFHHIPVDERQLALTKCSQILADNGQMFLFEHNPYNPLTRWVFERCAFDADAEMLSLKTARNLANKAGFTTVQYGYTLFFPRQFSFLRGIEPTLKYIPLGAQYYVQMSK